MSDFRQLVVAASQSVGAAMACLDRTAVGIVLVLDGDDRLRATLTDGDVRRGILAGATLETSLETLLELKRRFVTTAPVTASIDTPAADLLELMDEHGVRHVPLLDDEQRVVDVARRDRLDATAHLVPQAVIMAGGLGKRLWPLTSDTPKPMLPVGDRPVMELIVDQLRQSGIRRVNVATHYLSHRIVDHFGDGERFGVQMTYVQEDQPLGTAGALGLMPPPNGPLLVINGDVLTGVDFRALLAFHRENGGALTVGVRRYEFSIPYGVVECDGASVKALQEKPSLQFFVNAGIYVVEPHALALIPQGERFDMTDLIGRLLGEQHRVVSFPIVEYWLDIGRQPDYQRAQADVGRLRVLPSHEEPVAA